MSMDVLKTSSELAAKNQPFALATVVRVEGSSSAKPGSKAIIDSQGNLVAGWIGGGCAESAVRHHALQCMESETPRIITLDMTDELLGVGMPCGGLMDVYIEPVMPQPDLLVVGHGRIAETLATLGSLMNFKVTVDDPGATPAAFPSAARLITDDLDLSAPPIGPRSFVVIATQHKGDHIFLQKALASEAAYIALVSSRHRANLVLDYLLASGIPRDRLERVWAPAGLDIGAATPEEIALSVMSQMVALRRGGTAEALKHKIDPPFQENASAVITECDLGLPPTPEPVS